MTKPSAAWGFGPVLLQDKQPWLLEVHTQLPVQGFPGDHTQICKAQGTNLVMFFNESANLGWSTHASLWFYLTRHFVLVHCVKISEGEQSEPLFFCVSRKQRPLSPVHFTPKPPHATYSAYKCCRKLNVSITELRLRIWRDDFHLLFLREEIVCLLLSPHRNISNNLLSLKNQYIEYTLCALYFLTQKKTLEK